MIRRIPFAILLICLCIAPVMGYNWSTMKLENGTTGKYGSASSLSLNTTGYPVGISYLTNGENLNYTWWSNGWGRTTVDNPSFGTGYFSSLKYNSNGYPAISYTNETGLLSNPPSSTGWTLVFNNGDDVYSLEEFSGTLYAGFFNTVSGSYCLKSTDGTTWTVSFNLGDTTIGYPYTLKTFGAYLYCGGSGWGVNGGSIYRTDDGTIWVQVYDTGDPSIYVYSLEEHGGKLYALLTDGTTITSKILESADGTTWNLIYTSPVGTYLQTLTSHGTSLYASVTDAHAIAELWVSVDNGVTWADTGTTFGAETYLYSTGSIGGNLYEGSYPNGKIYKNGVEKFTGAINGIYNFCECEGLLFACSGGGNGQVYRSVDNGANWVLDYDIPSVAAARVVFPFQKRIYVGTTSTGKIYRSGKIQSGGLYFAQWNGAGWDYTVTDTDGAESSLAINSTNYQKVAYVNKSIVDDLYFSQWSGTAWDTEKVDVMGSTSSTIGYGRLSLALNATENASISYYNVTDGNLKFAQWDGTVWNIETVDSAGDVGLSNSLAFNLSDRASISYYNASSGDLKFAQWNGTGWFNETVDSIGDVGLYTSLAIDPCDFPHISYFDKTNGNLKHAWRNDSGWFNETIDTAGNTGYWSSIAIDQYSNMFVSYFNQTDVPSAGLGELRFAYYIAPPPSPPNIIYGLVLDDNTGLPINGANANIRNATYSATNISNNYGGIPGVYWFEGLAPNENYYLNTTKIGYTRHADVIVNTGPL